MNYDIMDNSYSKYLNSMINMNPYYTSTTSSKLKGKSEGILRKTKKTKNNIKKKTIDELKKSNKKKKVKEKGSCKENNIENLNLSIKNLSSKRMETSTSISSPLVSQAPQLGDSTVIVQRKSDSCLITPIHTPTLSEDTTIKNENDGNPTLIIPKMQSISTPKRKNNSLSKTENHIHTPVSPSIMNGIPYISTPTYLSNCGIATSTPTTSITKSLNTPILIPNKNKKNSKLHSPVSSSLINKLSKKTSSSSFQKNDKNNEKLGQSITRISQKKNEIQLKPNSIPNITLVPWAEQNTYVYQIEIEDKIVSRRFDNHFVNGTKLLNVAGLTRGKRDAILKNEPIRNVVKNAPFHLKGVWIPIERARILSLKYDIDDRIIYLLEDNPSKY